MSYSTLKQQVGNIAQKLASDADAATERYMAAVEQETVTGRAQVGADAARFEMQRLRSALAHARMLLDAVERL